MQFLQLVGIIMISNSTLVLVLEVYYCIQQPAKHQSLKLKNIHQRAPLDGGVQRLKGILFFRLKSITAIGKWGQSAPQVSQVGAKV